MVRTVDPSLIFLHTYPVSEEVAGSMSKLNNETITVAQLATWNPNLLGVCDGLPSQFVCAR